MALKDLLAKAEKEVAQNRHWRAKEMLRSNIPNYGYELPLIRMLADVLMEMKDAPTAGKYLFLSVDDPDQEQREAIDIFFKRFSQRGYQQIIGTLPKRTRMERISDYPKYAQTKLREIGAPETLLAANEIYSDSNQFDLGCWIFAAIALAFVVCAGIGAMTIGQWILNR